MKKRENSLLVWGGAVALTVFAGVIAAQEATSGAAEVAPTAAAAAPGDATPPAAAPAEAAPAEAAAAPAADKGVPAAASAAPVKPRASELFPLANRGLMLDVTNTGKHLIAVGDRGTVLASNNGKDWAQVKTPVRSALTAVSFADENTGWAVGHDAVIIKSADGGKTWALQNFQPELEKAFLDVLALDASNAIAVGAYGLLYKTADGGTTWTQLEAPAIREGELHLNGIAKLGNGTLIVVGEQGTIGLSADGGTTWEKVKAPYEGSLYGALPVGDAGAMLYGLRGNVFSSPDAKATPFTAVPSNTVASFFGATKTPDGGTALVGLSGMVMKMDSAGSTKQIKVKIKDIDGYGHEQIKDITGSFSSAVAFAGGLIVVGEQGVQSVKLN